MLRWIVIYSPFNLKTFKIQTSYALSVTFNVEKVKSFRAVCYRFILTVTIPKHPSSECKSSKRVRIFDLKRPWYVIYRCFWLTSLSPWKLLTRKCVTTCTGSFWLKCPLDMKIPFFDTSIVRTFSNMIPVFNATELQDLESNKFCFLFQLFLTFHNASEFCCKGIRK